MKFKDVERMLNALGFYVVRKNKHIVFSNGIKTTTVPHQKIINPFLVKKIMRHVESI